MAKFSLSQEVASKVEEHFPTHTVTFDGDAFPDPIDVTFRNLIALSTEERKRYNTAAAEVQRDLQKLQDEAKALDDAAKEGEVDPKAAARFQKKLEGLDAVDLKRALQVKQLSILASDESTALDALNRCDAGQVEVVTLLLLGGPDEAGLATGE